MVYSIKEMDHDKERDDSFYIEAAEVFTETFQFRTDTFFRQVPAGYYLRQQREITPSDIIEHLKGKESYAVCPVFPGENTCHFAVIDLDTKELSAVKTIVTKSELAGLDESEFLLEFSGNKGFHFWYIFEDTIPAAKARKFCQAIAGTSALNVEIFPKQDSVDKENFGNNIKLPFGLHRKSNNWSELVDKAFFETLDWIGYLKYVHEKIPLSKVDKIVNSFTSPAKYLENYCGPAEKLDFEKHSGLHKVLQCEFVKYCDRNAKELPEPLWYSMITNLLPFKGGRELVHKLSKPYNKGQFHYSAPETDRKIQHALKTCFGPYSCQIIAQQGFICPKLGQCGVKSPAGLGTQYAKDEKEKRR